MARQEFLTCVLFGPNYTLLLRFYGPLRLFYLDFGTLVKKVGLPCSYPTRLTIKPVLTPALAAVTSPVLELSMPDLSSIRVKGTSSMSGYQIVISQVSGMQMVTMI